MRSFFKNVLAMAIGLGITLLVLEGVLRTTHLLDAHTGYSEPHPLYGWKFAAGRDYWAELEGGHAEGVINSYGWRDREWQKEKSDGVYRVAIVGDSFVEALQVEEEDTFTRVAEQLLNDEGQKVELMNFGRSGATTTEEFLFIREEVMDFKPDLVVVVFFPYNDIRDMDPDLTHDTIRPFAIFDANGNLTIDTSFTETRSYALKSAINSMKQSSALVSLMATQYNQLKGAFSKKAKSGDVSSQEELLVKKGFLSLATDSPVPDFERAYALNKRMLHEIKVLVEKEGAKFMLMNLPFATLKPEIEEDYKRVDNTFDHTYFDRDLGKFAQDEGIGFLPLEDSFRVFWQANDLDILPGHFNPTGHQLAGKLLAEAIKSVKVRSTVEDR